VSVRKAAQELLDELYTIPVTREVHRAVCHLRTALAADTVEVPRVPSEGRLVSMAIRDDHGLGVPGYYDNPMFKPARALIAPHQKRMESAMARMRQLYEEAIGLDFYQPEREDEYRKLIAAERIAGRSK
jgi:hypothetical protein